MAPPEAPYARLTPDRMLDALESVGLRGDGRFIALNSYENRVYQVSLEDGRTLVAKFYRPGRWSDAQIREARRRRPRRARSGRRAAGSAIPARRSPGSTAIASRSIRGAATARPARRSRHAPGASAFIGPPRGRRGRARFAEQPALVDLRGRPRDGCSRTDSFPGPAAGWQHRFRRSTRRAARSTARATSDRSCTATATQQRAVDRRPALRRLRRCALRAGRAGPGCCCQAIARR